MDGASLFGYSVMVGNPLQKTKKIDIACDRSDKNKETKKRFFLQDKKRGNSC